MGDPKPSKILGGSRDPQWAEMREANRILDEPQFARRDVLEITGLTDAQLKNTLDRDLVRLTSFHNPGTGRRRLFTGADILKIIVAHTMSAIGFPMKWSYLVADEVSRRASSRLIGLDLTPGLVIATYPMKNGDWARIQFWEGEAEEPKLPVAAQILQVDRLIDETLAKLRAAVADEPIPNFDVPDPKPTNPYSPEEDFFRMWDKDTEGRQVYVGLTYKETQELDRCRDVEDSYDEDGNSRYLELHDKHERARLDRIEAESPIEPIAQALRQAKRPRAKGESE